MIPSHPLISGDPDLCRWSLEISRKSIRHIYFRLDPVSRTIGISVPHGVSDNRLDQAIRQKLPWMQRQVGKLKTRGVQPPPSAHVTGEIHPVLGTPHTLEVHQGRARVESGEDNRLLLYAPARTSTEGRGRILESWYRGVLSKTGADLVHKWEPVIQVSVAELRIRRMKTRWGSCNIQKRRIWLALGLAALPMELVEYVVVHEMVHLLEAGHNARFYGFMDGFLPGWKRLKQRLNQSVCG